MCVCVCVCVVVGSGVGGGGGGWELDEGDEKMKGYRLPDTRKIITRGCRGPCAGWKRTSRHETE